MKIKTVVFDMDGLLVNTEPLWTIAETELIESRGGVFRQDIRQQIIGLRGQDIVAHFKAVYNLKDSVEALHEELDSRMVSLVDERVSQKTGAQRLLQDLFEKNVPMAVASSSTNALIGTVLSKQDWEKYFRHRCSAEDETAGKPAPDVYLTACRLFGEPPENCLALEDSLNGAKAAVAAGMPCFVIPSSGIFPDPAFHALGLRQFENLNEVQLFSGI